MIRKALPPRDLRSRDVVLSCNGQPVQRFTVGRVRCVRNTILLRYVWLVYRLDVDASAPIGTPVPVELTLKAGDRVTVERDFRETRR